MQLGKLKLFEQQSYNKQTLTNTMMNHNWYILLHNKSTRNIDTGNGKLLW